MCETDRVVQYFTSRSSVEKEQKPCRTPPRSDENKTTII